jgi:hypothetical protein
MALNLSSHVIKKSGGGSSLSQVDPYVRLSNGTIALFVQNGAVYSEDGQMLEDGDLPDWLNEELAKLTPEAQEAVGLVDRKPSLAKPKEAPQSRRAESKPTRRN